MQKPDLVDSIKFMYQFNSNKFTALFKTCKMLLVQFSSVHSKSVQSCKVVYWFFSVQVSSNLFNSVLKNLAEIGPNWCNFLSYSVAVRVLSQSLAVETCPTPLCIATWHHVRALRPLRYLSDPGPSILPGAYNTFRIRSGDDSGDFYIRVRQTLFNLLHILKE